MVDLIDLDEFERQANEGELVIRQILALITETRSLRAALDTARAEERDRIVGIVARARRCHAATALEYRDGGPEWEGCLGAVVALDEIDAAIRGLDPGG